MICPVLMLSGNRLLHHHNRRLPRKKKKFFVCVSLSLFHFPILPSIPPKLQSQKGQNNMNCIDKTNNINQTQSKHPTFSSSTTSSNSIIALLIFQLLALVFHYNVHRYFFVVVVCLLCLSEIIVAILFPQHNSATNTKHYHPI